jgi:glycosyltransferase involved in cell wall biosynthesis
MLQARRPPQLWRSTGLLEKSLGHVDAFIAPSRFTREKHLEFGLEVDAPIVHIPNFIPLPEPAPANEARPHERPYFLFAGRLEPIKGAHLLVDEFRTYEHADLLLAGLGNEAQKLRDLAGDARNIHFLGGVPYAKLERFIRHAIGVIVPSLGFEVFPTVVLEAYAQGTPVIGHRLGPLPEMLNGCGGVSYTTRAELRSALDALRGDPDYRGRLGRLALETYRANWTPDRHLAAYFALIADRQQARRPSVQALRSV